MNKKLLIPIFLVLILSISVLGFSIFESYKQATNWVTGNVVNEVSCASGDCSNYGLEDFPRPFIKVDLFDGIMVIGNSATSNDVIASVDISTALQFGGSTGSARIKVGAAVLASEVSNPNAQNMILIGRPSSIAGDKGNSLIDAYNVPTMSEGQALLKLVKNGNYFVLIVSGEGEMGPRFAARVLTNYQDYALNGKQACIQSCSDGLTCLNLIECENEIVTQCSDSDNGLDYYESGTATVVSDGSIFQEILDVCKGDSLIESYCAGEDVLTQTYNCPGGCEDSACITVSSSYGLEDYPRPFIKNELFYGIIVVGDAAYSSDVIASMDIATSLQLGSGTSIRTIPVGSAVLASEVSNPKAQNMVLVGRPTSVAGEKSNVFIDGYELPTMAVGESVLKIVQNGDYVALIVSGEGEQGPRRAARVLRNYDDYSLHGDQVCIQSCSDDLECLKIVECKASTPQCTDSDNGKNYYLRGSAISGGNAETDTCYSRGQPIQVCTPEECELREVYCDSGKIQAEFAKCEHGCETGSCIRSVQDQPICKDSDDSDNKFPGEISSHSVKGYVDMQYPDNSVTNGRFWDTCLSDTQLVEYYCGKTIAGQTKVSKVLILCDEGCFDSVCNPKETRCPGGVCPDVITQCQGANCPTNVVVQDECSQGCLNKGNCIPYGIRVSTQYCDIDSKLKTQIKKGICFNNYECATNVCIDRECVKEGFWRKLCKFFRIC